MLLLIAEMIFLKGTVQYFLNYVLLKVIRYTSIYVNFGIQYH